MFSAISLFITTYEKYFWIGLCVFCLFLGGYTMHVWNVYQADEQKDSEITNLQKMLTDTQAMNKTLADKAAENAKIIADLNAKMAAQKKQLEDSYAKTPEITTVCIAPVRVQSLNDQRNTANTLRR